MLFYQMHFTVIPRLVTLSCTCDKKPGKQKSVFLQLYGHVYTYLVFELCSVFLMTVINII